MKTATFAFGFAQLLAGIAAQEWRVLSYTGLRCNGELLDTQSPLVEPAQNIECQTLEYPVRTASIVLVVDEDNADTWSFGLFDNPNGNSCGEGYEESGSYRSEWFPGRALPSSTEHD